MRISDWSSDVCSSDLFAAGMVFEDGIKRKRHIATQEETDAVLVKRIAMVKRMRAGSSLRDGRCRACGNPLGERERTVLTAVAAGEPVPRGLLPRSEESTGGKECVRTCRSRGSP